ncbi:MAG: AsmA family protein [Verrucomicrobiales bacterium]
MSSSHSRGTKKGSVGKKIGIAFVVLFALLLVVYFVATSSAFFKAVILPKVSASLNADVQVEDASISPFSSVTLKKLTVKTTGAEPVIAAEEVRAKYSLMDILGGNINVSEVTLVKPTVNVVNEADGTSNLDPLLKKDPAREDEKETGAKEESQINISNISLQNGTIRQISKQKNGGTEKIELTNLNLTLDKLGTGQRGKLAINSDFSMDTQAPGANDLVRGKIEGGYDIALNKDLMPEVVQGATRLNLTEGQGAFATYSNLNAVLEADITPTEIKQLALRFAQGQTSLGQVRVSGPFDINKTEGRLRVELLSLDKNLLNFAGAGNGMDFRNSTFNSTNLIELSQGGDFVAATGALLGNQVSVVQNGEATPEVNLNIQYQANVDLNAKTAVLQKLQVSGLDGNTPFLQSSLDRQMNLSWGDTVRGFKDASLKLVLTNFNLAAWKPVIGTNVTAGIVNADLTLTTQQDGKLIKTDLAATIANLTLQNGTNTIKDLNLVLDMAGLVEQMNIVNVSQYRINLQQGGEIILNGNGLARYDLGKKVVSAQITSESSLGKLAELGGIADLQATAGLVKINGSFSDDNQKQTVKATFDIVDWTGKFQDYVFNQYGMTIDCNLDLQGSMVQIYCATLAFAEAGKKGGTLDLTGKYDQKTSAGQFTFKTSDINEAALRPFLASSLGDKKLFSILFAANGTANLGSEGETTIKTDLGISNLVVDDPSGALPKDPLAVKMSFDGGKKDTIINIRELIIGLTPTDRARNELKMVATLDMNKAHPKPSSLALTSEGLDVTAYYNIFSGNTVVTNASAVGAAQPSGPAPAVASNTTNAVPTESEPITLPFGDFTGNIKVDRFYLREVAITNLALSMTMSNQVVAFPSIAMSLNGGAVDGNLSANVGVPGYQYIANLKIDHAPLEPLANSFTTNPPGMLQGNIVADLQVQGTGSTGKSLQKSLAGDIKLALTNMNYQVVAPKWKKLLVPIAAAVQAPELLQTPINFIDMKVKMGEGNINLEAVRVASEAFLANVHGIIPINEVLTNSPLNLPVELSLRRSLAAKIRMLPANTPEDAKYAPLPNFVSIKGTIGNYETDINKTAIAFAIAEAANKIKEAAPIQNVLNALTGEGPVLTGTNAPSGSKDLNKAAEAIQGFRNILGGGSARTNAPATLEVSTNNPPAGTNNPASTNNPAANPGATTNEPVNQVIDLFNRFKKK